MLGLNTIRTVLSFLLIVNIAEAGVVLDVTRVIYEEQKKEVSLSAYNNNKKITYLTQSWVETDTDKRSPFIITPPLFRLEPSAENILRIVRTGGDFPADRESLFWINVKAIQPTNPAEQHHLSINVKTRIKLFYRPQNLPGKAHDAYQALQFSRQENMLQAYNPTAYHISFARLQFANNNIKDPGMIAPYETKRWPLPTKIKQGSQVLWQVINDYGGFSHEAQAKL